MADHRGQRRAPTRESHRLKQLHLNTHSRYDFPCGARHDARPHSTDVRFSFAKPRQRSALLKGGSALAVCLLAFNPSPFAVTRAPRAVATAGAELTPPPLDAGSFTVGKFPAAPWSRQKATGAQIRTDHKAYAEPPLPQLPRAGGKYVDAVFGTEIMRATDERDGAAPGLGTYYSHWPTFNADSTRLLIRKGDTGDAVLKRFDPARFEIVGAAEALPNSLPRGGGPSWESAIWSRTDPNVIYTFASYYDGGMRLFAYDVTTRRFTLLKDFSSLGGPRDWLAQMSMGGADDVFAFSQRRSGNEEPVFYLVWRRSTDEVLRHEATGGQVDEVRVDKSGQYLSIGMNTPTVAGSVRGRYVRLATGAEQLSRFTPEESPPGHGDLGTGIVAGFDRWAGGINVRRLDDVRRWRKAFRFTDEAGRVDWTQDFHATLLADDESWLTVGTFDDPAVTLPDYGVFEDEIMQIALDGSGRVRRLCHTRARIDNRGPASGYWAMPKPTISRDGRFVAYTSNWEGSSRYDLFIAKIEPAPPLPSSLGPTPETTRPRRAKRSR